MMIRKLIISAGLIAAGFAVMPAHAQFNPLSIISEVVTTTMDVRTKDEVKNDLAIAAGVNERLIGDDKAEWAGVGILVFAQHVVLAGAVKTAEAKQLAEKAARADKRVRSLRNDLIVIKKPGDEGSFLSDKTIDTKVNATLTATEGIGSVNMRWKTVNGTVVLMGVAQSDKEAALALAKIRALDGVKAIKNRLRIVPKKG